MDIIKVFCESHDALRCELEALAEPFKREYDVGWDDCLVLDKKSLLRDISAFIRDFKKHESEEDGFLAEVAGLLNLDADTVAVFAEGRRSLREYMQIFGAVAFVYDGVHVHRVREIITCLRAELGPHLAYEEKILFPLLRERLPARLLVEYGREVARGNTTAASA
ncbi:MAG: hypothetical protein AAB268_04280 [Elusimicrobiota bacterium]